MKKDNEGFNATKAMANSLAVDEPPKVVVNYDQPPSYNPDTHTVSVPGFVMSDMPKDLRTMYRAYLDHELGESEISDYGRKLDRLYGGRNKVPDKLVATVNSINDGLRVDAWQGGRFPGAEINIKSQVRQDLKDLVAAYNSQPRRISPERAGIGFVATIGRYIADGIITVSQAKQMFPRFQQMFEQVEDDLLWIEDNVDHDDPASSKLEDDIIHAAERIYYKLRGVEPPKPGASQQERQEKAEEARKPGEERGRGGGSGQEQGQGQGSGRGRSGGGSGSSQGNGSGSSSNEDGDRSQEEQGSGDSDADTSDEESDDGDDNGGDGDLKEDGDGDENDADDSGSTNEVDTAPPQDIGQSGGSQQDTVVDHPVHPEGDFDWNPEDNLADAIKDRTEELERSGSTYVELRDPHDRVKEPKRGWRAQTRKMDRYQNKQDAYRRYGGALATRMRQAMVTPGPVKVDRQRRGNLDQRRVAKLAAGQRDAFKKTLPRDRQDVAVALAVDESGSMAGAERDCASDLTWTWAEACDRLDAPLEILSFSGSTLRVLKGYDDSIKDKQTVQNITSLSARGGTPLATAILVTGERLSRRQEDQKILFCLTDGGYNSLSVRKALEMCERHGITVVFIGAGVANPFEDHHDDELANLFEDWITVTNPRELALTASKKLVKMIRKDR